MRVAEFRKMVWRVVVMVVEGVDTMAIGNWKI